MSGLYDNLPTPNQNNESNSSNQEKSKINLAIQLILN